MFFYSLMKYKNKKQLLMHKVKWAWECLPTIIIYHIHLVPCVVTLSNGSRWLCLGLAKASCVGSTPLAHLMPPPLHPRIDPNLPTYPLHQFVAVKQIGSPSPPWISRTLPIFPQVLRFHVVHKYQCPISLNILLAIFVSDKSKWVRSLGKLYRSFPQKSIIKRLNCRMQIHMCMLSC